MVMNLEVPKNAGSFWTSWVAISFWEGLCTTTCHKSKRY